MSNNYFRMSNSSQDEKKEKGGRPLINKNITPLIPAGRLVSEQSSILPPPEVSNTRNNRNNNTHAPRIIKEGFQGFQPEKTAAPFSTEMGIRGSAPVISSRKFIDVHETMKGVLGKQEGRDDVTYDSSRFPTYSTRLNLTGQNAIDTSSILNTITEPNNNINIADGTILNTDGAIILGPNLSGTANGTNSGDTSAKPDANILTKFAGGEDNRPIGVSDYYFYFDSFYKETASNPALGIYVFDVRKINGNESVKNVIGIELDSFFLPKIETDPDYQPEYYFFRTVFMEIQSISSRQITKNSNPTQNFHFELEIEDAGSAVKAIPKNPIFTLTEPLYEITLLSVQFKIPPTTPANYPNDVFAVTAVFPSILPPPGDRRMVTNQPHGLVIGQNYSVYFTGYNSNSSTLNNIINDPLGQIIEVIDATTIQLTNTPGANAIGVTPTALGTAPTATMFVGPLRIAFRMRMRTIRRTETNFITPISG